jgi:prepilin-type N-terminal cleavage/methylation domain-containing protein
MKKRSGVRGQRSETRGQGSGVRGQESQILKSPNPQILKSLNPQIPKSPAGFTLIELLVTITIIGILAGMAMGVMRMARQSAAEAATKATVAKLHAIIMRRYESYITRRVPLDLSTDTSKPAKRLTFKQTAQDRLLAIRDIIRMEMPDRLSDITNDPIVLPASQKQLVRPALSQLYLKYMNSHTAGASVGTRPEQAEMLYLLVTLGSPEAMSQFNPSEIGDTDKNGYPEFLDGWGRPIAFLRWAPGCSANHVSSSGVRDGFSDVQSGDPQKDHDPFDPRRVDPPAYHLIPLIYSSGSDGKFGLNIKGAFSFSSTKGDIFSNTDFLGIGAPYDTEGSLTDYQDNITNHHIEAR